MNNHLFHHRSGGVSKRWLSDHVLRTLQSDQQAASTALPSPRMVQILSRSGGFWESRDVKDDAKLMVTDGQYIISVELTPSSRQAIWKRTCNPPPMNRSYTFLDYSRGCCGVISNYGVEWGEKPPRASFTQRSVSLVVNDWEAKPSMKDLVCPPMTVLSPLMESVDVRHALQQAKKSNGSRVVLGDVEEALNNPVLMNTILQLAAEATATSSGQIPPAASKPRAEEEHSDEDSEEDEIMNINDMLATQPSDMAATQQQSQVEASEPQDQPQVGREAPEQEDAESDGDEPMQTGGTLSTQSQDFAIGSQEEPETQALLLTQPLVHPLHPQEEASQAPSQTSTTQATIASSQEGTRPSTFPPPSPQSPLTPRRQGLLTQSNGPTQISSAKSTSSRKRRSISILGTPFTPHKKRQTSLWKLMVDQLQDPTNTMITLPVVDRPTVLHYGLSRWLSKNTVQTS